MDERRLVFAASVALLAALLCLLGESAAAQARTSGGARECLQRSIPPKILEELKTMTDQMVNSLPKDAIKYKKILPKLGKSIKKPSGISVLKEVLEFYYKEVFSKVPVKHENVLLLMSRLEKEFKYCLTLYRIQDTALLPKDRSEMADMRKRFTALEMVGIYKAVGEFKMVLAWIDTYIHERKHKDESRRRGQ